MVAQATPLQQRGSASGPAGLRQVLTLNRKPQSITRNSHNSLSPALQPEYPPMLISTWFWMMQSGPSDEVKFIGEEKLKKAFGSIKAAEIYLRQFPEYCR